MKRIITLATMLTLVMGCSAKDASKEVGQPVTPIQTTDGIFADIKTTKGLITVRLEMGKTPLTVCNFVGLAEGKIMNTAKPAGQPYYDGISFHRVIDNFMIQTGDPLGNGTGGPGYQFADEIDTTLKHFRDGTLSMANAGAGTNGSQFFITHLPTSHLDGKHTVFGYVTYGQDAVNAVRQGDKIESIAIRRVGEKAAAFTASQAMFDSLKIVVEKNAVEKLAKANEAVISQIKKLYPNAVLTSEGYYTVAKRAGEGETPKSGTKVSAHYEGKLLDGTVFDSSIKRGVPFQFVAGGGQVIRGWDLAFLTMKKGEQQTIILPPELAYGSRGAGGIIPPNAWLIFDVELVDF